MSNDARGWRVALVPDALVNLPAGTEPDMLRLLDTRGVGILQLPPTDESHDHGLLLAVIADQVAEYAHHGYAVVAIGLRGEPGDGLHWRRLSALLRRRGVAPPPRFVLSPGDAGAQQERLDAFLANHDIPAEQQRIWRT